MLPFGLRWSVGGVFIVATSGVSSKVNGDNSAVPLDQDKIREALSQTGHCFLYIKTDGILLSFNSILPLTETRMASNSQSVYLHSAKASLSVNVSKLRSLLVWPNVSEK